jgi:hypothetical protein
MLAECLEATPGLFARYYSYAVVSYAVVELMARLPSFSGLWYPRMPAIRHFFRSRPRRLARPRTPAFHVGNTGSNPVGDANPPLYE